VPHAWSRISHIGRHTRLMPGGVVRSGWAAPVRQFRAAVPADVGAVLRRAFGRDAAFWEETGYHTAERGYFSFWRDLRHPLPPPHRSRSGFCEAREAEALLGVARWT
jgi:hypothetical protein